MTWKLTTDSTPANYSDEDPLDMEGLASMIDDLHTEWWSEDEPTQRKAIANAFRAALVSPRQVLKWNSIVYQDLMHIEPDNGDGDHFEQTIRERKEKWDRFGQMTTDLLEQNGDDEEWIDYGKKSIERYMPGIWQNIRNAAVVGPYIEDLRQAAIEDVKRGGDGRYFRESLLNLEIPGIGPKIASFVWLLLAPKTSKLATIDIWMMRVLGQDADSPKDYQQFLQFEQELDKKREEMGYDDIPLGMFQWALWDWQRTPGYHQDHSALRPLNPVDWRNVDWSPQERVRKIKPEEQVEGQGMLFDPSAEASPPTQFNAPAEVPQAPAVAPSSPPPMQQQQLSSWKRQSTWQIIDWTKRATIDPKEQSHR